MRQSKITGLRCALVLAGALFALVPVTALAAKKSPHGSSATPPPVQAQLSSSSQPKQPMAIPLANVAIQAAQEETFLQSINPQANQDADLQEVESQLPALTLQIDKEMPELEKSLRFSESLGGLQALQQTWESRQLLLTKWQGILTARADTLQSDMTQLAAHQLAWNLTGASALAGAAPPEVITQINEVRMAILTVIPQLDAHRGSVLVLQAVVVKQLTRSSKALSLIAASQKGAVGSLLAQDASPLWALGSFDGPGDGVQYRVSEFYQHSRADFSSFFSLNSRMFLLLMGTFWLLVILFSFCRRRIVSWKNHPEYPLHAEIFASPVVAALAVVCFVGSSPLGEIPHAVRWLMSILTIAPMILMVQTVIRRKPPVLYVVGVLFVMDAFRQIFVGMPLLEQCLLLLDAAGGIGIMIWWQRKYAAGSEAANYDAVPFILRFGRKVSWLIILIEAISCAAVLFGYLRLARLLVSGLLVAAVMAMVLFVFIRMMNVFVAVAIRAWPLKQLRMVSDYRNLLEGRINTLFIWLACFVWLERALDYLGLLNPVLTLGRQLLTVRLQRASFSISVGEFMAFIVTLLLTFMLASFIGFALRNEVFPRVRMTEGVSYAFSSLLRYLLVVVGFIIALGEVGITVDRIIIIISAFSIGIGFGLQNIVSNFLSGLILLFERPLHVGDMIEFGSTSGNVWQIGIRSSKVRTLSGADIIVPNSQLVTEQVTNWTYTDRQRRIDLPVGVNYGADPRQVIALLQDVAHQHPGVLDSPATVCLMTGYGDSSINFELRAWTDHSMDWWQVRSDLAVGIFKAVTEAEGMSFPFPQREVRVLNNAAAPVYHKGCD